MLENYLKRSLPYWVLIVVVLLLIDVFYLGEGTLAQQSWVSIFAVTVHLIFIVISGFALFYTRSLGSTAIDESGSAFLKAIMIGLTPLYILLALLTGSAQEPMEFVFMAIYFVSGAYIEELTFRYALPRLLFFYGYGFMRSLVTSNFAFTIVHWFAWEMSPSAFLLGLVYGMANGLALSVGGSFTGVAWSHGMYNLFVIGAAGAWMAVATITVTIIIFARRVKR